MHICKHKIRIHIPTCIDIPVEFHIDIYTHKQERICLYIYICTDICTFIYTKYVYVYPYALRYLLDFVLKYIYIDKNVSLSIYVCTFIYPKHVHIHTWKFIFNKNVLNIYIFHRYTHMCVRKIHVRICKIHVRIRRIRKETSMYIWKETYKRDPNIYEQRLIKETSAYMKRNLQREEYVYAEYVYVYTWKFILNKNVSQYNYICYKYTHICIRKIHIRIRKIHVHIRRIRKETSIYIWKETYKRDPNIYYRYKHICKRKIHIRIRLNVDVQPERKYTSIYITDVRTIYKYIYYRYTRINI